MCSFGGTKVKWSEISLLKSKVSVLLLVLVVAGAYGKPLGQYSDDSVNNIDEDPRIELDSVQQGGSVSTTLNDAVTQSSEISSTSKPGLFSWFLAPLSQNVQISPQTLQDRVTQIKETLSNLGLRNRDPVKGKQLSNANNLLHLIGPNDSGFYTNRIEPAGFFGGNGWLANKGGILGGPGAIFSTGSILTDYPTAYRRK